MSESDDEEAHDEDDYYFSMVKTLTENDISSSKLVSINDHLSALYHLYMLFIRPWLLTLLTLYMLSIEIVFGNFFCCWWIGS